MLNFFLHLTQGVNHGSLQVLLVPSKGSLELLVRVILLRTQVESVRLVVMVVLGKVLSGSHDECQMFLSEMNSGV